MMRRSSATAVAEAHVAGVALGAKLRDRRPSPRPAPCPRSKRRRELPLLVLVELGPARRLCEPSKRLGVRRDPRRQRLVEAPRVLGLDGRRVLVDRGSSLKKSRARAGPRAPPPSREAPRRCPAPAARNGQARRQRLRAPARGREAAAPVSACSSSAARLMASLIDACDALNVAIALSSEPRRIAFIWPRAPSRTAPPGRRCAVSCPMRRGDRVLVPRDLLAQLGDDGAGVQLA